MSSKTRIAVLFGGQSAEHEVSLQSAHNIIEALDKEKYDLLLVGITHNGQWLLLDPVNYLQNAEDPSNIKLADSGIPVILINVKHNLAELRDLRDGNSLGIVDVVFPIIHGTSGEDGALQGLLKSANVAFVGADVLGSAVGMDKDIMKKLLRDANIPIADFVMLNSHNRDSVSFTDIKEKLALPLFIKPANAGSSVGIHKVQREEEYQAAIDDAFKYDHKVIVEEFIDGREVECSVLGNEKPIASLPGEIIPQHEFYSYEAKYIDPDGAHLQIPADLPEEQVQRIQQLAVKTFRTLACEGMARVDMFLTADDSIYVNEINTIPGFTKISMYPKLWEVSGIPYPDLLDTLIHLALERFARQASLHKTYF